MSAKKSTIRRAKRDKENPYVQILKAALRDKRLSWKARGILAYILTNKDTWKIYVSELANHSDKDGRDGTASGFRELIEFGYVTRIRLHDKEGKFQGYDHEVTEYGKPVNGLSVNGSAVNGKDVANNKELVSDKEKKGVESAVAEEVAKPAGRDLILLMAQPTDAAVAWMQKRYPEASPEVAKELATYAMEFKKHIEKISGHVTVFYWAVWEAMEFWTYWNPRHYGRGKTKRTQLKNQIADMEKTIANRVREQTARAKYTRLAPGSPDFGKKPWEINKDKPEVRTVSVEPTMVEQKIEY